MSEAESDEAKAISFCGLSASSEMALFGFLLNLCGVLAILISCGLTLYHCGWLGHPFDIQQFGDGIGKLIQDDLIATGVLAGGMGVKAKLGG